MRRPRHCILANHTAVPREVQGNSARFWDVTGPIVDGCETRLIGKALRSGVVWRWEDSWTRQASRRLCKTGRSDGTWSSVSPCLLPLEKRAGRQRGLRSVLTATPSAGDRGHSGPFEAVFSVSAWLWLLGICEYPLAWSLCAVRIHVGSFKPDPHDQQGPVVPSAARLFGGLACLDRRAWLCRP
ncbi:uncharacterized protein LY79DRAFT_554562 [Colletotrichum navitas]|uniref:Uncharacterized protein n=1 Tax=Colletotrichum navitas TaxID=681940 RepID=A0AAD8V5K3_9PEZI|nr:uncharacterized protein LY79DRAFT_554562 [Colletotrichum navitas]KAK1590419.1 hypothetical protein LY79DRAFT_554562 [Colletotrichum navitas]